MSKKKICALVVSMILLFGAYFVMNKPKHEQILQTDSTPIQQETSDVEQETPSKEEDSQSLSENATISQEKASQPIKTTIKGEIEHSTLIKHGNLYSEIPSDRLPLSAITEIADLPQDVQAKVNKIIDSSNNIYMLKRKKTGILIVSENQDNIRHGIDFVEIATPSGHQTVSTFGYNGKIKDSENDIWEYDKVTKLPTKHTKYNQEGDVEFTEIWNYELDNPVKYEMKNADGKTISIRKETLTDNDGLRVEHLLYDPNGNTKANVTTTFEGADIKRFTYYNADKPSDGASLFSEYKNGKKVKETVYSNELKVNNIYEATYIDDQRDDIKILDSSNNLVGKVEK